MGLFKKMAAKREDAVWRIAESHRRGRPRIDWLYSLRVDEGASAAGYFLLTDQRLIWVNEDPREVRLDLPLWMIFEATLRDDMVRLNVGRSDGTFQDILFRLDVPGQHLMLRQKFVDNLHTCWLAEAERVKRLAAD